jgi:hypothetical protein
MALMNRSRPAMSGITCPVDATLYTPETEFQTSVISIAIAEYKRIRTLKTPKKIFDTVILVMYLGT